MVSLRVRNQFGRILGIGVLHRFSVHVHQRRNGNGFGTSGRRAFAADFLWRNGNAERIIRVRPPT